MKKILLTVMILAFVANVSAQLEVDATGQVRIRTENPNNKYNDTITVGYRQQYLAPDNAFSLQFDSIRDRRPPEGSPTNDNKNVKVSISLTINGQNYRTALTLLAGGQTYAIAQGLRFELLAVEPRPLAEPADYRITLAIQDCEDVGQYLIDGRFEEARQAMDNWLKEPKPDKPEPKKKNRIFTVWNNSSTNTEVG
jgi:hypothetical protein